MSRGEQVCRDKNIVNLTKDSSFVTGDISQNKHVQYNVIANLQAKSMLLKQLKMFAPYKN